MVALDTMPIDSNLIRRILEQVKLQEPVPTPEGLWELRFDRSADRTMATIDGLEDWTNEAVRAHIEECEAPETNLVLLSAASCLWTFYLLHFRYH